MHRTGIRVTPTTSKRGDSSSALVAAVRGALHDIGGRMVADHFEMAGWRSFFLGADTPDEDLIARRQAVLAASRPVAEHWRRRLGTGCSWRPTRGRAAHAETIGVAVTERGSVAVSAVPGAARTGDGGLVSWAKVASSNSPAGGGRGVVSTRGAERKRRWERPVPLRDRLVGARAEGRRG